MPVLEHMLFVPLAMANSERLETPEKLEKCLEGYGKAIEKLEKAFEQLKDSEDSDESDEAEEVEMSREELEEIARITVAQMEALLEMKAAISETAEIAARAVQRYSTGAAPSEDWVNAAVSVDATPEWIKEQDRLQLEEMHIGGIAALFSMMKVSPGKEPTVGMSLAAVKEALNSKGLAGVWNCYLNDVPANAFGDGRFHKQEYNDRISYARLSRLFFSALVQCIRRVYEAEAAAEAGSKTGPETAAEAGPKAAGFNLELLEVGSGYGMAAASMRHREFREGVGAGGNFILRATSPAGNGWNCIEDVENLNAQQAIEKYPADCLVMIWPERGEEWPTRAVQQFREAPSRRPGGGKYLIYCGEGAAGCTGAPSLFVELKQHWERWLHFNEIESWGGIFDYVALFRLK